MSVPGHIIFLLHVCLVYTVKGEIEQLSVFCLRYNLDTLVLL